MSQFNVDSKRASKIDVILAGMPSLLYELRFYRHAMIGVFVIGIIARAQIILNPLYSIDTYSFTHPANHATLFTLLFTQGRFGEAALRWLGEAFDFGKFDNTVGGLTCATLLLSIASLLFARVSLPRLQRAELVIYALIFLVHPFITELFHFSEETLIFSIAVLSAAIGLFLLARTNGGIFVKVIGTISLVMCLYIYQTAIVYVIVAYMFGLINRCAVCYCADKVRRDYITQYLYISLFIGISMVIYIITDELLIKIIHVPMTSRFNPAGVLDIRGKLSIVRDSIFSSIWPPEPFLTRYENILSLIVLCASTLALLWKTFRDQGPKCTAIVLVILICSLVVATSMVTVGGDGWIVPRTLSGFAIYAAATAATGWRYMVGGWRLVLSTALVFLVVSFVGISNRIIHDQALVNRWDMNQANRIVARLEELPDFRALRTIVIVGGFQNRPLAISSLWGDLNISAFGAEWAKLGLIEQTTGLNFSNPTDSDREAAKNYCQNSDVWPAQTSSVIIEHMGIVCLTKLH
jgi:hypothetical protein